MEVKFIIKGPLVLKLNPAAPTMRNVEPASADDNPADTFYGVYYDDDQRQNWLADFNYFEDAQFFAADMADNAGPEAQVDSSTVVIPWPDL